MASTEIEYQQPGQKKGFCAGIGSFFYNSETGTCCGRTFPSWGKIITFYLVYYICLAGWFAGMIYIFFETISDVQPKQIDFESLLKKNPGMGFRPQLTYESTLIKFHQGDPNSYKGYTENIQVFLDQYNSALERNNLAVDCGAEGKDTADTACLFDMSELGDKCTKDTDFGYYMGTPCVLLKLNKIFGWEPEFYNNDTMPEYIKDTYKTDGVFVTCGGDSHLDTVNMGKVDIFPSGGFLSTYFPFRNQPSYQAPVVMARFNNLQPGVLVQVWCKAWANNIYHHRNDKMGSVHFELLMD